MALRSKSGILDLHKGRNKWKGYMFKVTGSTYFHYFSDKKMTSPKEQILLSQLKSVDVSHAPPKGRDNVFEVKAKGAHWIMSAPSHDEMIQWMEAIQPNCTKGIKNPLHKTDSTPVFTHTNQDSVPLPSLYNQTENGLNASFNERFSQTMPTSSAHSFNQPISGHGVSRQTMTRPQNHTIVGAYSPSHSSSYQETKPRPSNQLLNPYNDLLEAELHPSNQPTSSYYTSETRPHPSNQPTSSYYTSETRPHPSNQPLSPYHNSPEVKPHPSNQPLSPYHDSVEVKPHPSNQPVSPYHNSPEVRPRQFPRFQQFSLRKPETSSQISSTSSPVASLPPGMPSLTSMESVDEGVSPYIEPDKLNMPPPSLRTLKHKQASLPTRGSSGHAPTSDPKPLDDYEVMISPKHSVKESLAADSTYMVLTPNINSRDDGTYTEPINSRNGTKPQSDKVIQPENREIVDQLSKQFTEEQLEKLLEMLMKAKIGRKDSTSTMNEDLGYLVHKSSGALTDKILVTQEDDPDAYDKRPSWAKAVNDEEITPFNSSQFKIETDAYNIPEKQIINMQSIGRGQFGEVFSADYITNGNPKNFIKVAVKTTKRDCTEAEKSELLREMAVMSCMVHPNIVKLYGVVTVNVPAPWIVLEYLPHGDLKKYLIKSPPKSVDLLVKYMVDVAMGMHYIADRGLIHRDLAARNVLVGEGELCKVADFGLLRELPQDDSIYYSTNNVPCPIRWMSPEAIGRRKFSIASDVWSYGILMWEMFNPKKTPYEGMDNLQVAMKVNEGYRLPTPRGSPPVVSRVMKSCWHSDPLKRPSFMLIATLLTSKVSANNLYC